MHSLHHYGAGCAFFCLFMMKSKKYAKIEKTFRNFATKGDKTVLIW